MVFVREFTDEDCRMLRERRLRLGLSYNALSRFLGASPSVLRKWESGGIRHCSSLYRTRLAAFLRGDYDKCFDTQRGDLRLGSYFTPPSRQLQENLRIFANCYNFMQKRPDLCNLMLNAAEEAARAILKQYYQEHRKVRNGGECL